jgi:hypothetical protein
MMSAVTYLERAQKSPIKRVWFLLHLERPHGDTGEDLCHYQASSTKVHEFKGALKQLKSHVPNSKKVLLTSSRPLHADCGDVGESSTLLSSAYHESNFVVGEAETSIELFNTGKFLTQEIDTVVVVTSKIHIFQLIHQYYWYATGKSDLQPENIPGGSYHQYPEIDVLSMVDIATGIFYPSPVFFPENQVKQVA